MFDFIIPIVYNYKCKVDKNLQIHKKKEVVNIMSIHKKITVNGMEFEMEIEMYSSRNYGLLKIRRGEFYEEYTWLYFEETLIERLNDIEEQILNDYEYCSRNYSL